MKIRLKNKPLAYFSNNPGIVIACMFVIVTALVIIGASQKKVTIVDDLSRKEIVTYKGTIRDVLEQNKIQLNPKDKILPGIESVVTDDMKIYIRRAVPVRVVADGKDMQFLSAEETVEDMLAAEGITYANLDKVYPETDTAVSKDMEVRVVRVTQENIAEKQKLAYSDEVKEMPDWERGTEKTLREGSDGEKLTTIKITYEDGVEKNREVVDEKVTKAPSSHLVAVGTLDWRTVSRGETIKFDRMIRMRATSYTNDIACTGKVGGHTATGTIPTRNSDGSRWSTVAVDPRVIPLGSHLWIEGYGFAVAEDVGGAVKGNIIDLFFNAGTDEYRRWSTRTVKVYILK
jgi:Uncharacterized protein conserved in bacteria